MPAKPHDLDSVLKLWSDRTAWAGALMDQVAFVPLLRLDLDTPIPYVPTLLDPPDETE